MIRWVSGRWRLVPLAMVCMLLAACGGPATAVVPLAGKVVRPLVVRSSAPNPASNAPVVYLDPGHGGIDTGTSGTAENGTLVEEKTVVLQVALRVAQRLRADGIKVVMTRTTDADPCLTPADLTPDGTAMTPQGELADIQCRINKANASHANVLVSFHMNAFSDPSVGGTQTFYDPTRRFGAQNLRLAQLIQQNIISALHAQGYSTPDRGVADDTQLQVETITGQPSTYDHLDLLGPAWPGKLQPSEMPGALCEVFFLSDPAEATAAIDPSVQDLIARAFTTAIEQFLKNPGGS